MGWMMKAGLFLFALFAAAIGAWIVAVPILGLLILPSLIRGKRRGRSVKSTRPARRGFGSWLNGIGVILILLSVVAFFSGGILSPIVFLLAGMALLFRHRLSVRVASRFTPVENSILLRSRLNPFHWGAVAEVKVSTRDVEGALSGVNERLLLVSNPTPRIFVVYSANSFSLTGAEDQLTRRMQSTARALVPLGVYLLPLGSVEAVAATALQSSRIESRIEDQRQFISVSDYGVVGVEGQHGFVDSFELYARPDKTLKVTSILSGTGERSVGLLTVKELLHEAIQKVGAPHPDRYTAFLSSMAATEGETLGQRLTQTESQQGQVILVASLGTPQVELTRAQLQAVARVYE
ncbi:MAG: hypothetical protein KGI38_09065 [Thaumarchaeota archaeon]|nr:hypothetical protein [Nitrososphaerota archaeon]